MCAACCGAALVCLCLAVLRRSMAQTGAGPAGTTDGTGAHARVGAVGQIQPHLPDPATATPQTLELQADILRARRFPADAMDYYNYAIARGGNVSVLTE